MKSDRHKSAPAAFAFWRALAIHAMALLVIYFAGGGALWLHIRLEHSDDRPVCCATESHRHSADGQRSDDSHPHPHTHHDCPVCAMMAVAKIVGDATPPPCPVSPDPVGRLHLRPCARPDSLTPGTPDCRGPPFRSIDV